MIQTDLRTPQSVKPPRFGSLRLQTTPTHSTVTLVTVDEDMGHVFLEQQPMKTDFRTPHNLRTIEINCSKVAQNLRSLAPKQRNDCNFHQIFSEIEGALSRFLSSLKELSPEQQSAFKNTLLDPKSRVVAVFEPDGTLDRLVFQRKRSTPISPPPKQPVKDFRPKASLVSENRRVLTSQIDLADTRQQVQDGENLTEAIFNVPSEKDRLAFLLHDIAETKSQKS
jgi:hypothetical protein